jgi:hypothetical protein
MLINKRFKIKRRNIDIVQFIIEGYEGMATVSTIDSREAIIQISIMPDYVEEISNILENLKNKYPLEEIIDYKTHNGQN